MRQWDPRCREGLRSYLLIAGLLAALFWTLSLSADLHLDGVYRQLGHDDESIKGWYLLLVGWFFGPLGLSIAWYANILLLICIGTMFFGQVPNFWVASVAFGIAVSGLFPIYILSMVSGYTLALVRGPAVWLWLASFLIVWIPAAFLRWPGTRPEPEPAG